MELESLRVHLEAQTGSAIRDLQAFEKVLRSQTSALMAAARAAADDQTAFEKLISSQRKAAAILNVANTAAQNNASTMRKMAQEVSAAATRGAALARHQAILKKNAEMTAALTASTQRLSSALNAVPTAAARAGGGGKSFGDAFFAGMQKAFFFMSAVDRVHAALGKLFDAMEEAARNQTAAMYFEEAGRSIERLRTAAGGMVSDARLVKKANLADSMGLSGDTFERLITVAQAASAKTGQSFDHMFDSIVLGTARSSRLLLDNLGIIVSLDEAQRHYAEEIVRTGRAHGKTSKQVQADLSEEEKKYAFVLELMRKTTGQVDELKKIGAGGAGVFDKWSASVDNLKQALLENFLPAIEYILGKLTELIDRASFKAKTENFAEKFSDGNVPGLGQIKLTGFGPGDFYTDALTQFENLRADVDLASGGLLGLDNAIDPATYGLTGFAEALVRAEGGLSDLGPLLSRLGQAAKALNIKPTPVKTATPPPRSGGGGGGGKGKIDWGSDIGYQELEDWTPFKVWAKEARARAEHISGLWLDLLKDTYNDMKDYAERMRELRAKAWGRGGGLDLSNGPAQGAVDWEKIAAKNHQEMLDQQDRIANGIAMGGTAVSGNTGAVVQMVGTLIGSLAGSPQIGSAIGAVLSPFLENMKGLTDVVMGLFNGITLLLQHAVGPLLETLAPLGPALEDLLAAVGILIGSAIRPLLYILKILIPALAFVVDVVTAVVIALSPLVEIAVSLANVFNYLLEGVIGAMGGNFSLGADALVQFAYWAKVAGDTLINAAIKFNNVIVDFVRWLGDLLGSDSLKEWGKKLKWSDFDLPDAADDGTEDNTDAVKENTRAVRDLAREFHNLPSGYKGNAAVYNAANNERPWWMNDSLAGAVGRSTGISSRLMPPPPTRQYNPYRG